MYHFTNNRWTKVKKGTPATQVQQNILVSLGWGKEPNITKEAAQVLIDSIREIPYMRFKSFNNF